MSHSLFRQDGGVVFSSTTSSTLYEPLISSSSSSNLVGYYEPLTSKSSTSSSSSPIEQLSERDHLASYQCATKLNECCQRHDWIGFGSLLSPLEIEKGINELQSKYDKEITPQTYISIFIPRLMKSNRGKYNNLIDFEFRREVIISNCEVAYVFNYIYKVLNPTTTATRRENNSPSSNHHHLLFNNNDDYQQQQNSGYGSKTTTTTFEEEEVLWITRESPNHCWKVQFSGTPIQQQSLMTPQCCIIL